MTFAYTMRDAEIGSASLAPMLPLTLEAMDQVSALARVEGGATVNGMPFRGQTSVILNL